MKYEDWLRYGGHDCDPYGNLPKGKCHHPDPKTGFDCEACRKRKAQKGGSK